jgi:golgi apparatus protein 1
MECLFENQKLLSSNCYQSLFEREKFNLVDQSADYSLKAQCQQAIEEYCHLDSEEKPLACLRPHLSKPNLGRECRMVIITRIMIQNSDARLNADLWKSCSQDTKRYCTSEFGDLDNINEELNGRVLNCLKKKFVANKLSKSCELEVEKVMREAANVDYRLDKTLVDNCLDEIEIFCSKESNDKKENCLRLAFQNGKITNERCIKVN